MARWFSPLLSLVLAIQATTGACAPPAAPNATHMLVNVLIGAHGASAVQCWSVNPPFNISQQAGTVGAKIQSLGDSERSTVVFFSTTADIDAGLHQAPDPQWVFVLQGSGVVTLPTTGKTLALPTGNIIMAMDTADVSKIGHETKWTKGTVVIQAPFKNKVVPSHTIINPSGPCPAVDPPHHH